MFAIVDADSSQRLKRRLVKQVTVLPPDFTFEVEYSETSTLNAKFNELSQIHDVWYAYHGSRVDNFHSILNNGLHAHLNKVSLTN